MKRKIRTGVTYLLVLLFVLGAGALVQQHMHSRSNAQASEEARELAELSEQEVPLAELPGRWDQTVIFDTPPQNL